MPTGDPKTVAPERRLVGDLLGRLAVDVDAIGVMLGRDGANQPVPLRLFRPEPLTVAFVGDWWTAQVLLFRCLGHGARVAVEAVDAVNPAAVGTIATMAHWLALDRAAGGAGDRVWRSAYPGGDEPAALARPLLRLRDVGVHGPERRPPTRAWETQLTVLPRLTPAGVPVLAGADVVLVQRLTQPEAALVGSALDLPREGWSTLCTMRNEMVAAFGGGSTRYVWLTPTRFERQLFG
ncbi:hypothetical protein GCM10022225_16120 [Plantactinospora mayteni]|uniref:Uncharacterized protein n=1 Tax=Plantactinospora mayteni TaxID=566021 RepID=A0ABQ4EG28_9ACTN|nr:hypothetical protein [Plantactinospora mayteni]GIG93686.1 hypothetical protein Pma05_02590 [Plantactinospora mayteni]